MKSLSEEGQKSHKNYYRSQKPEIFLFGKNYEFQTSKMSPRDSGNTLLN